MSTLPLMLDQQKFLKEWADKFNALVNMATTTRSGVASIAAAIAQNFAAVKANLDANSEALEQLDVYNQVWAKMFLCLIERMISTSQIIQLQRGYVPLSDQEIKTQAKEDFTALLQECKSRVLEEREAYIKALRAQADNEQKRANEGTMAETALRNAEQSMSTVGGEGSAIPEGADIFGG